MPPNSYTEINPVLPKVTTKIRIEVAHSFTKRVVPPIETIESIAVALGTSPTLARLVSHGYSGDGGVQSSHRERKRRS